jgi:hypothetical protein
MGGKDLPILPVLSLGTFFFEGFHGTKSRILLYHFEQLN